MWLVAKNYSLDNYQQPRIQLSGTGFVGLDAEVAGNISMANWSAQFNTDLNATSEEAVPAQYMRVDNVALGGTDVSFGTWIQVTSCAGSATGQKTRLLTVCSSSVCTRSNQLVAVNLFDDGYFAYNTYNLPYNTSAEGQFGGCRLNVRWQAADGNSYMWQSARVPVVYYTWQYVHLTVRQDGTVSFGVGVPGNMYIAFEQRATDTEMAGLLVNATSGQAVPGAFAPSGVAPTPATASLTVGSPYTTALPQWAKPFQFVGALADVQLFLMDMTQYANGNFLGAELACHGTHGGPPDSQLFLTLGSPGFVGNMSDVQLYDTILSHDLTQIMKETNNIPAACVDTAPPSPPPFPEPPAPVPPPPSPVYAPPPSPPLSPPPYTAPTRYAPPMLVTHPAAVNVTGCSAQGPAADACGLYINFHVNVGDACPTTSAYGAVVLPTGLTYFLDTGAVYRMGPVANPFDPSGSSDFFFWLYSVPVNQTTFAGVIGVAPCAPWDTTLGETMPAARYVSFTFDVVASGERFSDWSAVTPVGTTYPSALAVEAVAAS